MAVKKKYKNNKSNNSSKNKKKKKYNNQSINNKKKSKNSTRNSKKNNVRKNNNNQKKKSIQNKVNNKKKQHNNLNNKILIDNNIEKENIVEVLNKDISFIDNENCDNKKEEILVNNRISYKGFLIALILVVISSLIIIFFPKIELVGDREIVISYKDSYVEPGYSASSYNKDITDNVYIDSNVVGGVIGEYEIKYYVDLFGSKLKKTRYVKVVDQDKPNIEVDNDSIDVCPNQKEIPDIKYKSIDEYDGNITDLVIKNVTDSEIILSVSDSSNNFISKTIMINRVDKEKPIIKLKGSSYIFIEYGSKYIEPGYEVSDNCSEINNDDVKISGSVGKDVGTYTITYEVSDEVGNKSNVTRKIVVGRKVVDNGIVKNGMIYLTFDDGPSNGTTDKILDILKSEGVKATFFVTNKGSDSLIKRMYDEGHTVALHTATHDYSYIYSSVDNYFNDLYKVRDRVKRITGIDSKIIRFPGGSSNTISRNYKKGIMTELTSLLINDGYRYFDWNVDAMDASSARSGDDVYYNVISNLSGNRANVVLMHDTKNITVNALRDIIKYGKNMGYNFSNIDMNTYMVRHSVSN